MTQTNTSASMAPLPVVKAAVTAREGTQCSACGDAKVTTIGAHDRMNNATPTTVPLAQTRPHGVVESVATAANQSFPGEFGQEAAITCMPHRLAPIFAA